MAPFSQVMEPPQFPGRFTIQAESGLQGASYGRIQDEAENNASTDAATLENNRQWQAKQAQTQGIAGQSRAQVQLSGIQRKSNVGTALQIAGGVTTAYGNNQKVVAAQNPTPAQKDKP
jgi:hypothetical protein